MPAPQEGPENLLIRLRLPGREHARVLARGHACQSRAPYDGHRKGHLPEGSRSRRSLAAVHRLRGDRRGTRLDRCPALPKDALTDTGLAHLLIICTYAYSDPGRSSVSGAAPDSRS